MSFAAMIGRRRQLVVPTPPDEPEEPPPDPETPDWDILRDFNGGTVGATAVGSDAFSGSAGRSVYTDEQFVSGSKAAKMTVLDGEESSFQFGGVVNFPTSVEKGDTLWLQLHTFLPEGFQIETPTNGSLKYLRIRQLTASDTHTGYFDLQFYDDDTTSGFDFRMLTEGQALWQSFGPHGTVVRGTWMRHTLCMQMDNALVAEGGTSRVRFWQDGALLTNNTAIRTMMDATHKAVAFYLYTYWNGGAPQEQSCYVDDIRIAKNGTPSWALDLEGVG